MALPCPALVQAIWQEKELTASQVLAEEMLESVL